jgi:hypothetical protein
MARSGCLPANGGSARLSALPIDERFFRRALPGLVATDPQ